MADLNIQEETSTLEELLATDNLFVEYFNTFLGLPSFPEPLYFNRDTGGFEVISKDRHALVQEVKAAARAGQPRKKIYRATRFHSFSSIPLIPMEDPPPPPELEIDTSFTVQTLNKEQGIEWIKAHRLPAFLKSDCYLEYRLAKLISQIPCTGQQLINFRIDYSEHERPVEDLEEEVKEDDTEVIMKNMFVCMGNASTSQTEAWVSQAKNALKTNTTSSTGTTSTSSIIPLGRPRSSRPTSSRPTSSRPTSSRPVSSSSSLRTSLRDSGIASPSKASSMGVMDPYSVLSEEELIDEEEENQQAIPQPVMPKPTEPLCRVSSAQGQSVVYADPTFSDDGEEDDKDVASEGGESKDSAIDEAEEGPMVFKDLEELSACIVGSALRNAFSTVGEVPVKEVKLEGTDFEDLNKRLPVGLDFHNMECIVKIMPEDAGIDKKPANEVNEEAKKQESDQEDSMLDSDEDSDDRDRIFKSKKEPRTYKLTNKRGVEKFKQFLVGSSGEKNWWMWLDIERATLITSSEELNRFIAAMRERYFNNGSALELSFESKRELGLTEASHWNLQKLKEIHIRMAEPLLLYWGPRFVLKEQQKVNPNKNYLYQQMQRFKNPKLEVVYPNPPTVALLPLRPKTCIPRVKREQNQAPVITDIFASSNIKSEVTSLPEEPPRTAPPPCTRRTYNLTDMFSVFKPKPPEKSPEKLEEEKRKHRLSLCRKTPKELLTAKIPDDTKRAASAKPAGTSGSHRLAPRPPSAPATNGRTVTIALSEKSEQSTASPVPSMAFEVKPEGSRPMRKDSLSLSSASLVSEFAGGRRMEGLLQALASERPSGNFMRDGLAATHSQLWMNCLDFWQELQQYHGIFYAEILDPSLLRNKAKHLYSIYIVPGAPKSIRCSSAIQNEVCNKIDPPFEELFDSAEEYVLSVLFEAWSQVLTLDLTTFDKVELVPIKRHLEGKSKYVASLRKRGIIKERPKSPEDPMDGYQDPVYDESLLERIPPEYRDFTLEKLVRNRIELEHLRSFLAEHYASMDLLCWMDIEAFRRLPHTEEKRRDSRAKDIKVKYLNKKYFFGPNSPAGKEGQDKCMAAGGGWGKLLDDRPPTPTLLEVQKYVRERLEKKWLPLFLSTEAFAERQRPQSSMGDVVEDVMIQKKKKSQAIWKMLESKWISSSKDILTFRKALNNPVSSLHFRKFVSIKGENFENDVLFWQEVQRYKDLCHIHSDRGLAQQKTLAIINCFIDSPIPPSLQIDITQEMADKIIERRMEAAPYLFREAQLTVFRVLFSLWTDFCAYRSNTADDKILPTLERHRRKAKADEKKKRKELEEAKEKEEQRRLKLGITATDEEFDPFERAASDAGGSSGGATEVFRDKGGKEAVSWSYSQYMKGLDAEDVLNNVDEQTFSSLSSLNITPAKHGDDASSVNDSASETSSIDSSLRTSKRRLSKTAKNSETDEKGSQTDIRAKKSVKIVSPKQSVEIRIGSGRGKASPSQPSPPKSASKRRSSKISK